MVTIRKCTLEDVSQIAELSKLWAEEAVTFAYPASNIEKISKRLGDYFWIAEKQGRVIGYTHGAIQSSQYPIFPLNALFLEINEVYVHPDFRDDGVGHKLVDRIIIEAESNGVAHALVGSSNLDWQRIVGFYERHGFKMWYVQMYRREGV
ncbi:GNAT family N-acetyltransferase [Paenibacillus thermotolerans]|uniref:GNAT family N-acetyltransferase n=1 Tax=Paenibacillus thermotolerans TaxID=3027807 RepID=UPI00236853F8|nr:MULTISPECIES: GNAT family N-acetyltransferase [unclassified Paenibacillus]